MGWTYGVPLRNSSFSEICNLLMVWSDRDGTLSSTTLTMPIRHSDLTLQNGQFLLCPQRDGSKIALRKRLLEALAEGTFFHIFEILP